MLKQVQHDEGAIANAKHIRVGKVYNALIWASPEYRAMIFAVLVQGSGERAGVWRHRLSEAGGPGAAVRQPPSRTGVGTCPHAMQMEASREIEGL